MISELQKPLSSGFNAKSESLDVLKDIDLNGKTAIVTGGYSGIGFDTTKCLVSAGAEVIIPAKRTEIACLLYTSPSPRDGLLSRMPSSA